ncbi:equilibrative nucleoside transporter 2 [Gadus macrocephalus]|uniref:equilibrative nucleoside transporter 2 n=1 Tax=Gadus macrocephalus TaxID=80720 RepID=UPI0028CB5CCD|nr:equilibrative nucleoside transporter 2 [Gadus macrocephalus]XP_059933287.1 equilibrative nucleoside transporter 2 [Gadus macrocephalus]
MKGQADAPRDRGGLVGIIFFILGLGTLLPWNFFMTASMYFQGRLNTTEWSDGEVVVRKEYYFNNWMTLLSQLPLLLFTLLNSILYQRISEAVRIAGSFVAILFFFVFTAILVKVDMGMDRFFSVTMATIWFINSFGAVVQGSLFGLVGQMPPQYSGFFMSGQGLAGTFAALAMIFAIASEADSETAALGYFITPCIGTLVTLLSYVLLPRLEFAQHYLNRSGRHETDASHELLDESSLTEKSKLNANGGVQANGAAAEDPGASLETNMVLVVEPTKQATVTLDEGRTDPKKASVMEVFKKIWVMAFCVTFVFTVTLSVFPAVAADVRTYSPEGTWERYFLSVCCFLVFNVNDWLGRTVTTWVHWPRKDSVVFPVLVGCRVVFVPLIMLCNVQSRWLLPVYFPHDAAFAVIMALFAFSSGYFVCLSMTYAPQMVAAKDAETAGALMTFFLALGLSCGAALSFALRALV